MRKTVLMVTLLFLFPLSAIAQKTIVLLGPYDMEEEKSESRSQLIADKVGKTVKESGREVILLTKECSDSLCLFQIMENHQADQAIFVSVEQTGMSYEIKLVLARGKGVKTKVVCSFSEALEEVQRIVLLALDAQTKKEIEPKEEKTEPKDEQQMHVELERNGPSPKAFWISLGITGVLVLSWGIVEGIGNSKLKSFSDKNADERTQNEQNRIKNLRIADGIIFTAAAAMVATTTVLFFLTDFENKKPKSVSFTPAIMSNGGAFVLQGSF